MAPSLSLAYARPTYACLALILHHLLEDYLDEVALRSALSFFLFGTLVPVSAVASMSSACTRCCLLTRSIAFTSVVPSSLITVSLTVRLTKASTAVDAVRLVPLGECHRLLAVAREGGEVREVVRDGGAVGEHLILQLPD